MRNFMDEDFLLGNETARFLYHEYAKSMPIIDYHCHVSPKEIYEDRKFENITQLWLSGDHYKWRVMRSNGIDESYITGDKPDKEKFLAFARSLYKAIGNPMYHWCHLELQRYFGYYEILNEKTAEEVWEITKEKLQRDDMSVRSLIKRSGVEFIGTTDDPIDDLVWHEKINADTSFPVTVAPSFRPDKAINIDKVGFKEYIEKLGATYGVNIKTVDDIKIALSKSIEHFARQGCKASDHGLDYTLYRESEKGETDGVLAKALAGERVSVEEAEKFKTELLVFCGERYAKLGWVMQIHFNCMRNPNSVAFKNLGADTGFDIIGPNDGSIGLARLLDELNKKNALPRTILYSLDASDNEFLGTLIGAFQSSECEGKIQHGSAWWFNDNKNGMREQMTSLANLSLLGNFVGMLTDSRSFVSYARHEYFRRILCDLVGSWVENGEYPFDEDALKNIIEGICYKNAKKYFRLEDK